MKHKHVHMIVANHLPTETLVCSQRLLQHEMWKENDDDKDDDDDDYDNADDYDDEADNADHDDEDYGDDDETQNTSLFLFD